MKRTAHRDEIEAAMDLFDRLGPESGCKDKAATILRSLVNTYVGRSNPSRLNKYLTGEEIEECKAGRKIAAIKLYRTRSGVGLKEAKDYIELHGGKYLRDACRIPSHF